MQKNKQDQPSKIAQKRIRDFFYHLVVYLFMLALLLVIGSASGALVWIGLVWGFAVALHRVYAFFS
jgi:hypothetical protein